MYSSTKKIDIIEDDLNRIDRSLLKIILSDKTTKTNILWATDDYSYIGYRFTHSYEMLPEQVTGDFTKLIQPRVCKSKTKQSDRTKNKAEVFTPSWVCNLQNNLVDSAWFGYDNVFNFANNKNWEPTDLVLFPQNKKWNKYVDAQRLEISCGEAPYLVSRYDSVSGKPIEIERRIGILDRKLRVVEENALDEDNWLKWAIRAVQSVYGYEFQGDNLLLARENILFTFIDYYERKFNKDPDVGILKKIANIIAWNIFQMDGRTFQVPYPDAKIRSHQKMVDLISEESNLEENNFTKNQNNTINYNCRVFDWRSNESIEFRALVEDDG